MNPKRVSSPILIVSLLAWGLLPAGLQARPPYKKALVAWLKLPPASRLNDCRTCHLPEKPGSDPTVESERPHNPFGARLKALRSELRQAGKKSDIDARLLAVAEEDSDGDGVPDSIDQCPNTPKGETPQSQRSKSKAKG